MAIENKVKQDRILKGRDKNQDICILGLGIKQESRLIISDFPLRVKNQEFWLLISLFGKESRYFQLLFLMANEDQKTRFKIFKEEISRIEENDDNTYYANFCIISEECLQFPFNQVYSSLVWKMPVKPKITYIDQYQIALRISGFSNELVETRQDQEFINLNLENGKDTRHSKISSC